MSEFSKGEIFFKVCGVLFLAIGIMVFAIRFAHEGAYALPGGAGFIAGLGLIVLGAYLLWPGKPRFTGLLAVLIATFALSPAVYSIFAEAEEVISLYAYDANNEPVDLRLWVVDRSDGAWVGMSKQKAASHKLDGARLDMLRHGEVSCVTPKLAKDHSTVIDIHSMKVSKYKVAQFAASIGLYPSEASNNTAALRLDPCQ